MTTGQKTLENMERHVEMDISYIMLSCAQSQSCKWVCVREVDDRRVF